MLDMTENKKEEYEHDQQALNKQQGQYHNQDAENTQEYDQWQTKKKDQEI